MTAQEIRCINDRRELTSPTHHFDLAMAGGYTCAQCLQVLRQGARATNSPARLQSLAHSRRRCAVSPSWIRSFGSDRNSNLPHGNRPEQAKVSSNSAPASKLSSPSIAQRAAASTSTGHSVDTRAVLKPDNLFHSFSNSPSPAIRQRAAFIKQNAFCPHPSHQQTRAPVSPHDPEARKATEASQPPAHSHFECPDCGVPIYCSEGHWMDDFEAHLEVCETIQQINEDDHDLHSGRFFPEFSYPGVQDDNFVINMTNWDTFMYTREFDAINSDRSMRQVTRMLTYPQTIASVLHELSPYSVRAGNRLTAEGLKSLSGTLCGTGVTTCQLANAN